MGGVDNHAPFVRDKPACACRSPSELLLPLKSEDLPAMIGIAADKTTTTELDLD